MKKQLIISVFLLNLSLIGFSQEQRNNIIVFPVRDHIFMWSFPNYWIADQGFANSIGEALMFYINGYTIQTSIAHFGIAFGDNVSTIAIEDYAIKNMNQWINNMARNYRINYIAERVNWNITRQDNAPCIVYKLYSNNNLMYQYCAIIQGTMSNYIIVYVQLNIEHEINEIFINDYRNFLEGLTIYEGTFEANENSINELRNLLENEIIVK
jgi:hypothetical protein